MIVVGQPQGSQNAQHLADTHPGRVAALVLVTPVPVTGTRLPEDAVTDGDHWPHVEHPGQVAAVITEVAAEVAAGPSTGWRHGFTRQSSTVFADAFGDDVVLHASVLLTPVSGRTQVSAVMQAFSSIYDSLKLTARTDDGPTTYLQWHATALGGLPIDGVTVLEHDAHGLIITAIAIDHRPLDAVLAFSAALRDRVRGAVEAGHFLGAARPSEGAAPILSSS